MQKAASVIPRLLLAALIAGAAACAGARPQTGADGTHLSAGASAMRKADDWYRRGCYPKALRQYRIAYPQLVAGDHIEEMAICLNNMGNAYLRSGKPESALVFYEEALDIDGTTPAGRLVKDALVNKAAALIALGRYDAAADALADARGAGAAAGPTAPPLMAAEARLALVQGRSDAARALLTRALAATGAAAPAAQAVVRSTLGHLSRREGALDEAFSHFEAALAADRRQAYYRGMADDLKAMGDIRLEQSRPDEAARHYRRSVSLYALIGAADEAEAARALLVRAAGDAGQTTGATLHFVDDWLNNPAFDGPCD